MKIWMKTKSNCNCNNGYIDNKQFFSSHEYGGAWNADLEKKNHLQIVYINVKSAIVIAVQSVEANL